ncbi:MAG: hypothetical protein V4508_03500 [Pseudomonadota bacterium]
MSSNQKSGSKQTGTVPANKQSGSPGGASTQSKARERPTGGKHELEKTGRRTSHSEVQPGNKQSSASLGSASFTYVEQYDNDYASKYYDRYQ